MRKQQKRILVLAIIAVFMVTALILPGLTNANNNPWSNPFTRIIRMLDEIYDIVLDTNSKVHELGGVPAPVEKTGQSSCWDSDGNLINCEGTGQDGEYQYGTPWPVPRFTDNLDGTVTDHLTGLIWLKDASCLQGLWAAALTECNTLNSGECNLTDGSIEGDWRLPNIRELQSLIDYSQNNPALPSGHPFAGVRSDDYWSSTTHSNVTSAFLINIRIGGISGVDKTHFRSIWPVRGGN